MKKKVLAAVLAALMLGAAVTVTAAAEITLDLKIHQIGDINGDGIVDIADYSKVLAHAKSPTGTDALTGYAFECGDVNEDGKINIADYLKVLAQAKGKHTLW